MSQPVEVQMLPADDTGPAAELADLINRVYLKGEEGLWIDNAARTDPKEVAGFIEAGQVAVARLDGRVVGCVRLQRLAGGEAEFGLLAADPDHRGIGVGSRLVDFAERRSRDDGIDTMQLELLVPQTWKHPVKEFLHTWYTRIGYRPVRTGALEDAYPHLAPLLATPCDFVIYHKTLTA